MNSIKAKNLSFTTKIGQIETFKQSDIFEQSKIAIGMAYPPIIASMVDLCVYLDDIEAGKSTKRFKNEVASTLCYLGGESVKRQILAAPEADLMAVMKTILLDVRDRLAELEQSIIKHLGVEDSTDFVIEENNKIIHIRNGKLVYYHSFSSTSDH